MMECPKCNNEMTLLLYSYVCDYCDGKKNKKKRLGLKRRIKKLTIKKEDLFKKTTFNDCDGLP